MPWLWWCNGNLTWAIVARKTPPNKSQRASPVQRKPDLGDRCKDFKNQRKRLELEVQRKPDLGDRCKFDNGEAVPMLQDIEGATET